MPMQCGSSECPRVRAGPVSTRVCADRSRPNSSPGHVTPRPVTVSRHWCQCVVGCDQGACLAVIDLAASSAEVSGFLAVGRPKAPKPRWIRRCSRCLMGLTCFIARAAFSKALPEARHGRSHSHRQVLPRRSRCRVTRGRSGLCGERGGLRIVVMFPKKYRPLPAVAATSNTIAAVNILRTCWSGRFGWRHVAAHRPSDRIKTHIEGADRIGMFLTLSSLRSSTRG